MSPFSFEIAGHILPPGTPAAAGGTPPPLPRRGISSASAGATSTSSFASTEQKLPPHLPRRGDTTPATAVAPGGSAEVAHSAAATSSPSPVSIRTALTAKEQVHPPPLPHRGDSTPAAAGAPSALAGAAVSAAEQKSAPPVPFRGDSKPSAVVSHVRHRSLDQKKQAHNAALGLVEAPTRPRSTVDPAWKLSAPLVPVRGSGCSSIRRPAVPPRPVEPLYKIAKREEEVLDELLLPDSPGRAISAPAITPTTMQEEGRFAFHALLPPPPPFHNSKKVFPRYWHGGAQLEHRCLVPPRMCRTVVSYRGRAVVEWLTKHLYHYFLPVSV